ncbi:MAG: PilC/PilY family type IV pilus protein [Chromatiales bacterium]|nr:PilC/PilY family type IV pilus protein [Chromatiales bacterium]
MAYRSTAIRGRPDRRILGTVTGNRWTLAFHPHDVSTGGAGTTGNDANTGDGTTRTIVARAGANGVATDLISARLRSSAFNTIYYDPEVRYRPWYNHDGSPFPNAPPSAAPLNPNNSSAGSVNLVGEQTFNTSLIWCGSLSNSNKTANSTTVSNLSVENGNKTDNERLNFCQNITGEKLAPAVYYTYNGNGLRTASNFTRVRIMDHTSFQRGPNRTDCAAISAGTGSTCTQTEEYQNFANWFTYNRTRMFLAIAAASKAFSEQEDFLRLGYARIHGPSTTLDGLTSPGTMVRGVRGFSGTDKQAFFTWLHGLAGQANASSARKSLYGTAGTHHQFAGGTPLRTAMDDVGQYFSRTDNSGPWGKIPGTSDSSAHLACRKNYHILMTDGMWTTGGSNQSNATARTAGAQGNVDNTSGPAITGTGKRQYQYSPDAPYRDTSTGTLADVAMYYWNRDLRTDLTNNVPSDSSNPAFWQHMVNFTIGLGVSGTLDFPDDWAALQAGTKSWPTVEANKASAVDDLWHAAVNSRGQYLSARNPDQFATALSNTLSTIINIAQTSTTPVIASSVFLTTDSNIYQATFDSSDWSGEVMALTPTEKIEKDTNVKTLVMTKGWNAEDGLPAYASRNILSSDGAAGNGHGISFAWASLTATQKTALNNSEALVNYLRGDDSGEGTTFRARAKLIGDIVNSDPVYVHKENFGFYKLPGTQGSSYTTFMATKKNRTPMLYVGANDGMLHGFNANTGVEVFAYVPNAVIPYLKNLADPNYAHRYYVDGDIQVSDAYIGGAWKTILIGTTGAGGVSGGAVFAIDVTNPSSIGTSQVLWEFTNAELGYPIGGKPVIARVKTGNNTYTWAAIFGNGYASTSEKSQLFILNLATGAVIKTIDTGVGSSAEPNGLSGPSFYNSILETGELDHASAVYAGDLRGNLWKFDLSSNNPNQWDVAFTQGTRKYPLFIARDPSNQLQPITVTPDLRLHERGGYLVLFGTGRYFSPTDPTDTQVQSIYGIWDNDTGRITAARSTALAKQEIESEQSQGDFVVRGLSNNAVDWTSKRGWYLDLVPPSGTPEGERVVVPPEVWFDRLRVAATIPGSDNPCEPSARSWYYELNLMTGGRLDYATFDLERDGEKDWFDEDAGIPVTGFSMVGVGVMPPIVGDHLVIPGKSIGYKSGLEVPTGRQTWREIR